MVTSIKFSQFATADLSNNTNKLVGVGGGLNIQSPFILSWTTLTRPGISPAFTPLNGTFGYNTTLSDYEFYSTATSSWIQVANNAIVNATYILQTPNSLLPNAQSLSALSTGILKSTTSTGVVSISAPLTSIDGLSTSADEMIYTTGSNVYATTTLTSLARTLLGDTTAAQMRSTLGLGTAAVKNATDNTQTDVVSAKGSFTIGHLLVAADTLGTAIDGGTPFGGGTVTEVDTGTGLTGGPITTTGTISFASIAANSLWVNNTSGSAVPTVTSLAALTKTDDTNVTMTLGGTPTTALINAVSLTLGWTGTLSTTRGGLGLSNPTAHGILVGEGASAVNPIVLSSGQILIGSTGVDPVAAAINSGTGILVGNGAGSITVSLSAIADHTLLANISGGSAAPSSTTLTALIDNALGSTQGDILYRNSTVWTVLAPGTSGFFLTSGGPAANPSWTAQVAPTGAALTKTDDTNVTLTLGGSPTVALLAATSLTLGWTGQLGLTRGGTAASLTASNGGIVYSTASALAILAGTATAGQIIRSGASTTPSWSTATYPATAGTAQNILTSDGTNWVSGAAAVKTITTQVFSASGTYTPTTGMLYCFIEVLGGGGAGGSSQGGVSQTAVGGSAGSGGYNSIIASAATIGASKTVTIGAGGTPGSAGNNAGGNGGTTSVGTTIVSAGGGQGGAGGATGTGGNQGSPGIGGTAGANGNFSGLITGKNGGFSFCTGTLAISIIGANGADSIWGSGGFWNGAGNNGAAANGPGGGGSGSGSTTTDKQGGAGAAGFVRITEYCNQ